MNAACPYCHKAVELIVGGTFSPHVAVPGKLCPGGGLMAEARTPVAFLRTLAMVHGIKEAIGPRLWDELARILAEKRELA